MDMVAILHGLRKIVNKINAIDFSGGTTVSYRPQNIDSMHTQELLSWLLDLQFAPHRRYSEISRAA
jgi:hypothetical protein